MKLAPVMSVPMCAEYNVYWSPTMKFEEILEACWKGYHKEGMKTMFGKRYPNCVKNTNEELEEDLRKWFKEKWVRFGPDGKIRGDCARGDDSEGKPKCLPQSKAQNLGKKGRASAASRKRRQDPNPERSGKAINVNTKKKTDEAIDRRGFLKGLGVAEGWIDSIASKLNGKSDLEKINDRRKKLGLPVCIPELNDEGRFRVKNGHPIATNLEEEPVPINLSYDRMHRKVIVGGAHSGGKTELLKKHLM